MAKWVISEREKLYMERLYEVEADTEEQAKELVRNGYADPFDIDLLDSETMSIEVVTE